MLLTTPAPEIDHLSGKSRTPRPCRAAADLTDYRLLRRLGEGGMGTVYLATPRGDGRTRVALKLMNPGGSVERFKLERWILARLRHPNVVRLYGSGLTRDGRLYLVLEFVDGLPLDQYCDSRGLPVRRRVELFHTVCSAVCHVHEARIVHRDLKPANVLVTREGTIKLLDFGIADPLDREHFLLHTDNTELELRMLTPAYASPEQIRGHSASTASDVYSLGALFYKLLTGSPPHLNLENRMFQLALDREDELLKKPSVAVARLVEAGSRGPLPWSSRYSTGPRRLRRQIAGDLDGIALRALHPVPGERYPSARELAEDVRRYLEGRSVCRESTFGHAMSLLLGRARRAIGMVVADGGAAD